MLPSSLRKMFKLTFRCLVTCGCDCKQLCTNDKYILGSTTHIPCSYHFYWWLCIHDGMAVIPNTVFPDYGYIYTNITEITGIINDMALLVGTIVRVNSIMLKHLQ